MMGVLYPFDAHACTSEISTNELKKWLMRGRGSDDSESRILNRSNYEKRQII